MPVYDKSIKICLNKIKKKFGKMYIAAKFKKVTLLKKIEEELGWNVKCLQISNANFEIWYKNLCPKHFQKSFGYQFLHRMKVRF